MVFSGVPLVPRKGVTASGCALYGLPSRDGRPTPCRYHPSPLARSACLALGLRRRDRYDVAQTCIQVYINH